MKIYIYAVEGSNHVYRLVGTADITDAKEATTLAVKYAAEYGCVDVCSGERLLATAGKEPDLKPQQCSILGCKEPATQTFHQHQLCETHYARTIADEKSS